MKAKWRWLGLLALLILSCFFTACAVVNTVGKVETPFGQGDSSSSQTPMTNQIPGGNGNGGVTNTPTHECEYALQSSKEMTCTEDGVKMYACSCGNTRTETITATHMSLSVEPQVDASCTAKGKTKREAEQFAAKQAITDYFRDFTEN